MSQIIKLNVILYLFDLKLFHRCVQLSMHHHIHHAAAKVFPDAVIELVTQGRLLQPTILQLTDHTFVAVTRLTLISPKGYFTCPLVTTK